MKELLEVKSSVKEMDKKSEELNHEKVKKQEILNEL
jgi:hypothetical protein